jgi:flavin reductase (DIM6/NTAB) family NADH-FMN oxidoreductase RutF
VTTNNNDQIDGRAFRDVMGLFATGVTVLTTEINGQPYGMTANALTSVSLDPLLVLVCVQKNAHMAQTLQQSGKFSINILSDQQQNLSNYFAGFWPEDADPPPFSFLPWVAGPRLEGVLGALACTVHEFIEGGDHWIITGQVVDLYRQEVPENPLLYYTGKYRQMLDGME